MGAVYVIFAFLVLNAQLPHILGTTTLEAVINMGGIKGNITFEQENLQSSTTIKGSLTKSPTINVDWSIVHFPVTYEGVASTSCASLGKVLVSLTPTHGTIATSGTEFTKTDSNIKLSGKDSINGRSLVLYTSGTTTPLACAIISIPLPTAAELFSAKMYSDAIPIKSAAATFRKEPFAGMVTFRQSTGGGDLQILEDLFLVNSAQVPAEFAWNIVHSTSSDCSPTGSIIFNSTVPFVIETAVNGPSTNRSLTTVASPSFSIAEIIGKTLVIVRDNGTVFGCTMIESLDSLMGYTKMNKDGVMADFHYFQLSPWEPTYVKIAISGFSSRAKDYHVHDYPLIPAQEKSGGLEKECSGTVVSGHWNPYGVVKSSGPGYTLGTYDEYELGDLSGKHGNFTDMDSVDQTYVDYNLPLFGVNSILHRSIVIHKNNAGGSRYICNTIEQKASGQQDVYSLVAKATFSGDVKGAITFTSVGSYKTPEKTVTTVHLKLFYEDVNTMTTGHSWHIPSEECSKSVTTRYNPYNVYTEGTYSTACGKNNMLRCEVGDLSGKSENCEIGKDTQQFYTDLQLPLMGDGTILGHSLVVNKATGASDRLGCATIEPVGLQKKTLHFLLSGTPFSETKFKNSLAQKLNIDAWRILKVTQSERVDLEEELKCRDVSFYIVETTTSDKASEVDKMSEDVTVVSSDFRIDSKCDGSVILPVMVCLVLAQIIAVVSWM